MYLKSKSRIYLLLLTTCIFCLIILLHFQSLHIWFMNRESESMLITNNSSSVNFYKKENGDSVLLLSLTVPAGQLLSSSSSSEETTMGDRRNSSQSAKSDKSDGSLSSKDDKSHFDIIQLNNHLKVCIRQGDNQVDMDEYIFTFQQLYKFFIMLGTVFGFVGSDVKSKIEILQNYRNGENKREYETLEKMVHFEKTTDFLTTNKESSGTRTFLRLHRALNFVSKFLGKMDLLKETDGTYHVCKEAYSETLSKFHPWLIQKGAIIAMYALPLKKDLINRVCDGKIQSSEVSPLLHEVINSTQIVYDKCQLIYDENDLNGLP